MNRLEKIKCGSEEAQTRSTQKREIPPRYRADIDGLRAIAVLSVVACHYALAPIAAGGYVGVDIFFVISGYLITCILQQDLQAGRFSILEFYQRRLRRIFPALFLVVSFTLFAGAFVLLPSEFAQVGREVIFVSVFASNIYYNHAGGYFDLPQQYRLLLHTWSLAVEEQFYIFWPWFVLVASRLQRGRHGLALFSALFMASLVLSEYLLLRHPRMAFYEFPSRAWELAMGAMIAQPKVASALARLGMGARNALALAGLTMILASIGLYTEATPFPGLAAILPCLGAALIISVGEATAVGSLLSLRPTVWIGRMSYSLYLWHWPLIVLARLILSRELHEYERWALLGLNFGLAWGTWRFVERPFRGSALFRSLGPRGWVAGGFAMAAVFMAAGFTIAESHGLPQRVPVEPAWLASADRDAGPFQASACLTRTADLPPVTGCLLGRQAAPYDVVLWGDSHASQWAPAIDDIGKQLGFTAREITKAGCGPFPGLRMVPRAGMRENCGVFGERALEAITHDPNVKIVILAAKWEPYVRGELNLVGPSSRDDPSTVLVDSLRDTIKKLNAHGVYVIVVGQTPVPPVDEIGCARRSFLLRRGMDHCFVAAGPAYAREDRVAERLLSEALPANGQAAIAGIFPQFCSGIGCRFGTYGDPLFMDATHLSAAAAVRFSAPIRSDLVRALGVTSGLNQRARQSR